MKNLLFLALALGVSACTSVPKHVQWTVDPNDKPALAKFVAAYRECQDFAYRAKVAGSQYTEADIQMSCVQRKGYDFKMVDKVQEFVN